MRMNVVFKMSALFVFLFSHTVLSSKDYYVSSTGTGKTASKEAPARDLGYIISQLQAGDTVHIAGGLYTGKNQNGYDKIEVPVSIIGGYDNSFSSRDPWGKYQTIFTGQNSSPDFDPRARLLIELHLRYKTSPVAPPPILIDGIIIDNKDRNRYTEDNLQIIRRASPGEHKRESPPSPGIKITAAERVSVDIRNCVFINIASATSALHVAGNKNSIINIHNNLILNNTGSGLHASTVFHINKEKLSDAERSSLPRFIVSRNTILFSWEYGPQDRFGGEALKVEDNITISAQNNFFGFSDAFGVDNIRRARSFSLKDNLFLANHKADYREWNSRFLVEKIPQETSLLSSDSTGNITQAVLLPLPVPWATLILSRLDIKSRQFSGTPLSQAAMDLIFASLSVLAPKDIPKIKSRAWLPPLELAPARLLGKSPYLGKYGCSEPRF